jgi:uncharacterized protein (DUF697 family)
MSQPIPTPDALPPAGSAPGNPPIIDPAISPDQATPVPPPSSPVPATDALAIAEPVAPSAPRPWERVSNKLAGFGKTVGQSAKQMGQSVKTVVSDAGEAIAQSTAETSQRVGNTAAQTGKAVATTMAATGKTLSTTVSSTSKTLGAAAAQTGKAVVTLGESATQHTHQAIQHTTSGVGKAVTWVTDNPVLRHTTSMLKLDWLLGVTDHVDVVKAEQAVRRLEETYPNDSPRQIAHRLMVEKAMLAGGTGLAGSFIPGLAAATFTVDLMATTLLQAELVYQIAAAYGLDLQDPARKGEVLAIFGLSLGGSRALKAGLGLLQTAPIAGALIGASSNAVMLYTLGHAACQFYSVSQSTDALDDADLSALMEDTADYQDHAILQQAVMDQILMHMVLAGHPDQSWETLLPALEQAGLSPTSLEAIAHRQLNPPPLEELLAQLDSTFANSVLSQCDYIAQLDRQITPEEQAILEAIAAVVTHKPLDASDRGDGC